MSADLRTDVAVEEVILVDPNDRPIGSASKVRAHREGLLHRAISIFVFDSRGDLLIQRRHRAKYHSGGLWSNTCCSHPRLGEETLAAARRRLLEEMGIGCQLDHAFSIIYRAAVPEGLIEHEYDHVFVGQFDGDPRPNPHEVSEWRRIPPDEIEREIEAAPERFTVWFRLLRRLVSSVPAAVSS